MPTPHHAGKVAAIKRDIARNRVLALRRGSATAIAEKHGVPRRTVYALAQGERRAEILEPHPSMETNDR